MAARSVHLGSWVWTARSGRFLGSFRGDGSRSRGCAPCRRAGRECRRGSPCRRGDRSCRRHPGRTRRGVCRERTEGGTLPVASALPASAHPIARWGTLPTSSARRRPVKLSSSRRSAGTTCSPHGPARRRQDDARRAARRRPARAHPSRSVGIAGDPLLGRCRPGAWPRPDAALRGTSSHGEHGGDRRRRQRGGDPRRGVAGSSRCAVLDEAPEFKSRSLQCLRQPLESGVVTIARARESVTYPAGFLP